MVTVTLQFLVFLIVTVTLKYSAPYSHFHTAVSVFLLVTVTLMCSAHYGYSHTAVFSVPNSHCHIEVFRSLWSLSHSSVDCFSWTLSL